MRICRFMAVVVLAIGMGLLASPGGAGAADTIPPLVTTLEAVLDGVGDVVDSLTSTLLGGSGADVTHASVEYAPGWVRMKVALQNPIDPVRDPRWTDASFIEWSFDTNGDATADYTVEFSTEAGELYGAVFDATAPDNPSLCEADSARFSAQDGYILVVDPKCIGNPESIGYAVEFVLDTNPADDEAPVLSDRVPDRGLRAVAAPVQPGGAAAAPADPITPHTAPPAPAVPAPVAAKPAAPASAGPRSEVGAVPTAPGPGPGASPVRSPAPAPAPTTRPASPAPASPAPATAPAGTSHLPRTGSASGQSALLGVGITLLGAGLLVMTGQKRPQPV